MKNERTPNVKCKFSGCHEGTDKYSIELNNGETNGPKWRYVCLSCKRTNKWETIACCDEHRELYQREVLAARTKNKSVKENPMKPIMSDMTDLEYDELMAKPIEQVEKETKQELSDMGYKQEVEDLGIAGTVEAINIDLNNKTTHNHKNKKFSKKI